MDKRREMIKELQEQAAKILKLKKVHRQKRPIVIEFSGSPKSGKTSCINSLELFLKRNSFNVKTVQERASVCPVSDKQSPMFNIWTACTALAGMIGTLEDKNNVIDVLILDRGIFDSLCWFDWLVKKGRMDKEQREILENFLLMEDLVKAIDIVFAFTVDPKISIEREYTHLLTDKLGTIMNEAVLEEYRQSVCKMKDERKNFFHKVFDIDTSNLDQNEVGKRVTEDTLEALRELLMEKIGYFNVDASLAEQIKGGGIFRFKDIESYLPVLKFDLRENVENKENYLQPIPMVVITNNERNSVLVIRKNKNAVSENSPEKDKMLVYIGGHSRFEDTTEKTSKDFLSICRKTLRREVKEEVGISVALNDIEPFCIYAADTEISQRHIAICFIVEQDSTVKLRLDSEELVLKRGKSKSGSFIPLDELKKYENNMEIWSRLILNNFFDMDFSVNIQISMFQNGEGKSDDTQGMD